MRGSDFSFSPFFKAYLVAHPEQNKLYLFTNGIISDELKHILEKQNIQTYKYLEFFKFIHTLPHSSRVSVTNKLNMQAYTILEKGTEVKISEDRIEVLKSLKSETTVNHIKSAHKEDAIALVRFFAWLKKELAKGAVITEYDASVKLTSFRQKSKFFHTDSFETISATGANAAIVHYRSKKDSPAISINSIYLCDSGGNYFNGTTDVTRTLTFSQQSEEICNNYTRVLKGNLAVELMKWPVSWKMTGSQLDILARQFLLKSGLNYGHGTGHGVGYFSNVHEPPFGIHSKANDEIVEGYLTSNEPGFYKENEYGIRIENLIVCQRKGDIREFYNLTRVPYERDLINIELLTQEEKSHINEFHLSVRNELLNELKEEHERNYLLKATEKI